MDEVDYVMFKIGKRHWEIKICRPDVLKDDFEEVDEAMFQGVEGPCDPIFAYPESLKVTFTMSLKL
jgi:hypothetical protein